MNFCFSGLAFPSGAAAYPPSIARANITERSLVSDHSLVDAERVLANERKRQPELPYGRAGADVLAPASVRARRAFLPH
jgi:hypothetical protein